MNIETLDSCNLCNSHQIESIDSDCNICQCGSCGYIFDNPRPTFEEIIRHYSKPNQYDSYLVNEQERDYNWKKRLKKMNKSREGGTLLDIGTGVGQFLYHAKQYYTQVYATEVSESAVKLAKKKYNFNIIKGDIIDISFKKTTVFDNISLIHVLEHVPNPKQLIEKCWSLLSNDGILVVAVPNEILSLKMKMIRLKMKVRLLLNMGIKGYRDSNIGRLGLQKITLGEHVKEIHLSHFTPTVLKQLLERSGFYIVQNSLDPINTARGLESICRQFYYIFCSWVMVTLRINIFDTIWMVAKKKA